MPKPVTIKELFRTAEHCAGCGDCDCFQGHVCQPEEHRIENHCPNCNKLMEIIQAGKVTFRAERCDCGEGFCKFCPDCCRVLSLFGVVPN